MSLSKRGGPVSAARSRIMASIRAKNTKPELYVRSALHRAGFRYILHSRALPGRPDIVLPKYRTAVQIHGCFWHYHECGRSSVPKTRRAFWRSKLLANRRRDARDFLALEALGWRVFVIWECELQNDAAVPVLLRRLKSSRARMSKSI